MDQAQAVNAFFLLVLMTAIIGYGFPIMRSTMAPWSSPTVLPEEVEAAEWADKNLPKLQRFTADLFGCEMITAVAGQICSVGGAWELADRATDRYFATERVFLTPSAEEAYDNIKKFEGQYVLAARRTSFYAFGWKEPNVDKFNDPRFFEMIYQKGKAYIYRVKS